MIILLYMIVSFLIGTMWPQKVGGSRVLGFVTMLCVIVVWVILFNLFIIPVAGIK